MKIAITGSNGFIGTALKNACVNQAIQAVGLCRNPTSEDVLFDLNNPETFKNIPQDINAIVHAAYTTKGKDFKNSYKANIDGSISLFDYCHKANIPIIFLSSCSAHEKAQSFYGKSKYMLESYLKPIDTIIRPGLVIGDGGVYQRLEKSIHTLKFAPLFWGGQQPLQIIYLDNLIDGILSVLRKNCKGAYNLVFPTAIPVKEFYRKIFFRLGITPRFLILPGDLAVCALKIAECLKIPLPLTSENLLGLKYTQIFASDCIKLGIEPLEFL